jgi:hypothetical protein
MGKNGRSEIIEEKNDYFLNSLCVPRRELCDQVDNEVQRFAYFFLVAT